MTVHCVYISSKAGQSLFQPLPSWCYTGCVGLVPPAGWPLSHLLPDAHHPCQCQVRNCQSKAHKQADVADSNAVKLLDVNWMCHVEIVVVVFFFSFVCFGSFFVFFEASTLKMSWWTTFCNQNISFSFYLESPSLHKKETAKRTSSVSVTCWYFNVVLILNLYLKALSVLQKCWNHLLHFWKLKTLKICSHWRSIIRVRLLYHLER